MTDDKDRTDDETAQIDLIGPSGGELLAAARREQKIALADIAKELHINEQKVDALERNDFEPLGPPVFAKGYMRKYAQLVGLDVDAILADYAELTAAIDNQPVIKARPRPRREMSPGPWIAVIVLVVAVVTAYWVFTTRPSLLGIGVPAQPDAALTNEQPDNSSRTPEVATEDATSAGEPTASPADDVLADEQATAVEEALDEADTDAAPIIEPAPADATPGDGQSRLLLTYSGDCWTEISDATGRRLFFGLGSAGRTVELSGTPPFDVLFGSANNVSLQLNGATYAIGPADRLGRARLSVAVD